MWLVLSIAQNVCPSVSGPAFRILPLARQKSNSTSEYFGQGGEHHADEGFCRGDVVGEVVLESASNLLPAENRTMRWS